MNDSLFTTGIRPTRNPYSKFNGTTSQYKYLHVLISKAFGKPRLCQDCGTTDAARYDWANLGDNYGYPYVVRREDWKRLCRSCHQKLDTELFIGKRFANKKHHLDSKLAASEAMKKYWEENRDKQLDARRRAGLTRRLRNGTL